MCQLFLQSLYASGSASEGAGGVPGICAGFMGLWVYGFMGLWVYGFMGLWVYGFMGFWVYGFLGLWV